MYITFSQIADGGDLKHIDLDGMQKKMDALKYSINIATQPLKAVYETDGYEEYISGFTGGEKKQTGFIFYCG